MKLLGYDALPDPDEMRFVFDQPLVSSPVAFQNFEQARAQPLALALMYLDEIAAVSMDDNAVTVTKHADREWPEVLPRIQAAIDGVTAEQPGAV